MQHVGRRQLLDLKTSNQSYLVLNKLSLSFSLHLPCLQINWSWVSGVYLLLD